MKPIPTGLKQKAREKVVSILKSYALGEDVKVASLMVVVSQAYEKGYSHGREDNYGQSILPPDER